MLSNLSITDGIYSILSEIDVKTRIVGLEESKSYGNQKEDIVMRLKNVIKLLENKGGL